MNPLDILIITPVFPPKVRVGGGVAVCYGALTNTLARMGHQDVGWAEFPIKYGVLNILKYGDNSPISKNLKNKFWFDMLRGIIKIDENIQFNKIIHIQNMPLWYSSIFELGYRKNWETKGYQIINDVLNENGELLNRNEMIDKGLNIHFLDYFKLKKKLRSLMQDKEHQGKGMGPFLPRILVETG